MNPSRARTWTAFAAAAAAVLAVTTAGQLAAGGAGTAPAEDAPSVFAGCDAFAAHVRPRLADAAELYVHAAYRAPEAGRASVGGAPEARSEPAQRHLTPLGGADWVSGINYGPIALYGGQRGADRPDLAVMDGTKVVTLGSRGENGETAFLDVVETAAGRPETQGSVAFPARSRAELLVLGGHRGLVVSTTDATRAGGREPGRPLTALTLVDWADPTRPRVLGTLEVQSRYVAAHRRGGVARVVLSHPVRAPLRQIDRVRPEAEEVADTRRAVAQMPVRDLLPPATVRDAGGRVVAKGTALECSEVRAPDRASGLGILGVLAIDPGRGLAGLTDAAGLGIVTDSGTALADGDRLLLVSGSGGYVRGFARNEIHDRWTGSPVATVHAYGIAGRHPGRLLATGSVPGHVVRGDGLHVMGRHIVVVTNGRRTVTSSGRDPYGSAVTVMAQSGSRLEVTGRVPGLGKGTQIHHVSWLGDLAALRIWKDDDLRVVDLSDPARPRQRGRGVFGGWPEYVHRTGPGAILAIGYQPDDRTVSGLVARGYDVRGRPAVTDTIDLGHASTPLADDPRPFAYLAGRKLAVFPATVVEGQRDRRLVLGVEVAPDGRIREVGRYVSGGVVVRVLPVGGRLAVVTNHAVALLDPAKMRSLGKAATSARNQPAHPV